MPGDDKARRLSRRGVVRASGGPLREVKIELGVVVLVIISAYFLTLGLDLAAWQEALGVLVVASLGAGWVVLRARAVARRRVAEGGGHGGL
ncbi:MAG: hypothetical protein LLP51_00585 [Halorhodospira halophila]|uniref:hypothetical protein n=1 Tax=Halorhodospira TaxID=85108 RepID=UPI001912030C|nr:MULTISPECIES: hypothetical protein [Halorhodospira]MCC3749877.1 hypothetical protein [Halorhodospira halophila]MCG5527797.1 hypothetical protein [Halorhodospira halophila]MCG5532789.1 hypothetical protein [Halorhodospira sp. 9621]MCG5537032.1 hypothetical protein [Halorhodospira sp. 9622]MCG5540988.1 hypothetical protein [Halorhodospira sp. M39old]